MSRVPIHSGTFSGPATSICLHKVLVLVSTVKKSLINNNKIPRDSRCDASQVIFIPVCQWYGGDVATVHVVYDISY